MKAKEHYVFCDFEFAHRNPQAEFIIMRHDIDYWTPKGLELARLERELGIKSTFFIQLHTKAYNVLVSDDYEIVREILRLGHSIGLHYDLSFYEENGLDPHEALLDDLRLLEKLFRVDVKSVSQHNPSLTPRRIKIPPFLHDAYSSEFTRNIKYIADSVMNWSERCFCRHLDTHRLQVNIHPLWWNISAKPARETVARNLFKRYKRREEEYIRYLETTWAQYFGKMTDPPQ